MPTLLALAALGFVSPGGAAAARWEPDGAVGPRSPTAAAGRVAFVTSQTITARGLVSVPSSGPAQARLFHADPWGPRWLVASPDGSHVAYVIGQQNVVYVVRADGSGRRKVADGSEPSWSPDGTQIVVVGRDGVLKVASAAGGDVRPLGVVGTHPAWSPASEWIAFFDRDGDRVDAIMPDGSGRRTIAEGASDQGILWSRSGRWLAFSGGTSSIHLDVIRSDGTGRRTLGDGSFSFNREPAWSPLDDRLAFRVDGSLRVQAPEGDPLVTTVNVDGPVAWSPNGEFVAVGGGRDELAVIDTGSGSVRRLGPRGFPHWSPDGTRLAYARDGVLWTIPAAGGSRKAVSQGVESPVLWLKSGRLVFDRSRASRWVIATVNQSGSERRLLRVGPTRFDGRQEFAELAWSPDGSRISYVRDPEKSGRLEVIGARGGPARSVATRAGGAAWSPDGESIAYSRGGLHVLRLKEGRARRLTRGDDGGAAWSPDGRQVGFVRSASDAGALYTIRAEGGPLRRLVADGVGSFSWSPDGRRIVFDRYLAIGVITIDSRRVRWIAFGDEDEETGEVVWAPRWSPDGTRIVYSSEQYLCGSKCSEYALELVSPVGNATGNLPYLDEATWSPDGRRLLGLSDSDGGALISIDVLTRRSRTIARYATSASWQPLRGR